ncbi:flagellar assembly protein FliW [Arthrobacter roseus]|uniref:flagellar assembly protein FliW n=1 Tax=Arthrobacter roseus TaxID=136274 RepID=UPI0019651FC5|nr:flagellar assembly protein FliW [Arthrobacter roseus]MBM7847647.1 flagellar assembly factor FliW [Arthrobacter roseus]
MSIMELTFITPPPGLAPLTAFQLIGISGAQGLYTLQSSEAPSRRLYVLDAAVYVPDYEPEISTAEASALELHASEDALVLVVANPGGDGTSVNLMAPIVVNRSTGACSQVILEGQDWPLHAQLTGRSA